MKHPIKIILPIIIALLSLSIKAQYPQLTNLPTIYINTFDGGDITSKTTYKQAEFIYIDGDEVLKFDTIDIRGRGNSTWGLPKKPYKIKLSSKYKLLGKNRAKAKKWTMLSNTSDKSLIRNGLASLLGEYLGLPFCPGAKYIDLYLNNKFLGNYQISDQVEVAKNRVDIIQQPEEIITDPEANITGGYLLEMVEYTEDGDKSFRTAKKGINIRIHYPEGKYTSNNQLFYIKSFVDSIEYALFGENFQDPDKGYRNLVDSTTLINYYLVNEISANPDGLWASYLYKEANDSHLYFGPIWDFDIAFNNCNRKGDVSHRLMTDYGYGWDYMIGTWFNRMWQDKWFSNAVNQRFNELMDNGLTTIMIQTVDSLAGIVKKSQEYNYQRWNINHRYYDELVLFDTYDEYITQLKEFIEEHNKYLREAFNNKKPIEPLPPFVPDLNYKYRIFNKGFNTGVIAPESTEKNAPIGMYENDETNNLQEWKFVKAGNHYQLLNIGSGYALRDVLSQSSGETNHQLEQGLSIRLEERQQWDIIQQADGYVNLKNVSTGQTANNSNGSHANGNPVLSYPSSAKDATSLNRLWLIQPCGLISDIKSPLADDDENYRLIFSRSSQRLYFITDGSSTLDFNISIFSSNGILVSTFMATEEFDTSVLTPGTYIVSWQNKSGKKQSIKFNKP
ncbi:MAG: CotH kinase family protein [Prevotellaceae bacterium]|nr:CotH kinase family protein [Candidatus Faecinaster equi]